MHAPAEHVPPAVIEREHVNETERISSTVRARRRGPADGGDLPDSLAKKLLDQRRLGERTRRALGNDETGLEE